MTWGGWRSGFVEQGLTRLARQANELSRPLTASAGAQVGMLSAMIHPLRTRRDV